MAWRSGVELTMLVCLTQCMGSCLAVFSVLLVSALPELYVLHLCVCV